MTLSFLSTANSPSLLTAGWSRRKRSVALRTHGESRNDSPSLSSQLPILALFPLNCRLESENEKRSSCACTERVETILPLFPLNCRLESEKEKCRAAHAHSLWRMRRREKRFTFRGVQATLPYCADRSFASKKGFHGLLDNCRDKLISA